MSCQESVSLGAYVLGALEPAERAAMERHLSGCQSCREEVVSLAPLPGLLRHTPFEELPEVYGPLGGINPVVSEGAYEPPFEFFSAGRPGNASGRGTGPVRPPAAVPAEDRRKGRGTERTAGAVLRRLRIPAAVALIIAVLALVLFVVFGLPATEEQDGKGPSPVATLTATDPDTRVTASAALTPKAWGTEMVLKLSGLPEDVRCVLVVHDRTGRTETGGSWASGHYASSTIPGSTSVNPQDITRIDIVSDNGDLLVSLPREAGRTG